MNPSHEAWQTKDYGGEKGKGLNLSKARLGEFVYLLLRAGGEIISTYTMRADFDKCYVQFVVSLPKGKRDQFVEDTGYALDKVSHLSLA